MLFPKNTVNLREDNAVKSQHFGLICLLTLFILFSNTGSLSAGQFPTRLGGFIIGNDISEFAGQIEKETFQKETFNPYIKKGEIVPPPGFKSGLIAYGLCDKPGKIVKIQLRYADDSREFFYVLLEKFRTQLGSHGEYKGAQMMTMVAWQWSFTNEKNERLTLFLQHYVIPEDGKKGTYVKLALTSQIENERACYIKEQITGKTPASTQKTSQPDEAQWRSFIPY